MGNIHLMLSFHNNTVPCWCNIHKHIVFASLEHCKLFQTNYQHATYCVSCDQSNYDNLSRLLVLIMKIVINPLVLVPFISSLLIVEPIFLLKWDFPIYNCAVPILVRGMLIHSLLFYKGLGLVLPQNDLSLDSHLPHRLG